MPTENTNNDEPTILNNCHPSENDDDDNDDDDDDDDDDDFSFTMTYHPITNPSLSFPTIEETLAHDRANDLDWLSYLPSPQNEDFHEKTIIFINKSRRAVVEGRRPIIRDDDDNDDDDDDDEANYFKPVLDDDALLLSLEELMILKRQNESRSTSTTTPNTKTNDDDDDDDNDEESNTMLKMRISSLSSQLELARSKLALLTTTSTPTTPPSPPRRDFDSYYFDSYSHTSIHETMLRDSHRTLAYQSAMTPSLLSNKIVLDVGCGTGILSLFAARAGAAKVYAVDDSVLAERTTGMIARDNGYDEGVINVTKGRMETVDLLEEDEDEEARQVEVDVIVSEWMGYALFFESMLPSVLKARDKYLRKDGKGTMLPNKATLYLEGGMADLSFWEEVYGFDMSAMKAVVRRDKATTDGNGAAVVECVTETNVVTEKWRLEGWDLNTCREEDLDVAVPFRLKCRTTTTTNTTTTVLDYFIISFDVAFPNGVELRTGCDAGETHWKQTTVWMSEGVELMEGDVLEGRFEMKKGEDNFREMEIIIVWELKREGNKGNGKKGCVRKLLKA